MKRNFLIIGLISAIIVLLFSLSVFSLNGRITGAAVATERLSPSDWLTPAQIEIFSDKVQLNLANAQLITLAETNSMDPLFDESANVLEILPTLDKIQPGDIISYESLGKIYIHRVLSKNIDETGVYFLVKGDNNTLPDAQKVRFAQIKGVVIAIFY